MIDKKVLEEKYAEATKGIKEDWLNEPSTKWYNYVLDLPIQLRTCYLVVVFHSQIFNGGFHQYFLNRYGQFAKETIEALKRVGAFEKATLLEQALLFVNSEDDSDEIFRTKLITQRIPQLFANDDLFEPLDSLESIYYSDENEDIEHLLLHYLRND